MAKKKVAKKKVVNTHTRKVFISHKHKDRNAAMRIIEKLRIYAAGKIEFYLSEDNPAGVDWAERIHDELKEADQLMLLYTDPTLEWDWCMYETGFFSRGLHDELGKHDHRLICLHRPKEPIPEPLRNWQSVSVSKGPISKMLKELYKGINDDFLENPESMEEVINIIIEAFSPQLKRNHFSKCIHVCLDAQGIKTLTGKHVISKNAEIRSDEKSLLLFGLHPKSTGKRYWEDIEKVFVQSNQETWTRPLIKNMINAYEDKDFHQGLPLFQSVNDQKFYHPVLHRLDRMPDGISKFTVIFVPMEVFETKGMMGQFNMVLILLELGHRFRWNVIEKYINETRHISSKATIDRILNDLDLSLVKNESIARVMGVFNKDTIELVFDEKDRQSYEKCIKAWNDFKKKFDKDISNRNLSDVKEKLKEMRKMNKEFMIFISGKYHELSKSLDRYEEKDGSNKPKHN